MSFVMSVFPLRKAPAMTEFSYHGDDGCPLYATTIGATDKQERELSTLVLLHAGGPDHVAHVDDVGFEQLVERSSRLVVAHGRRDRPLFEAGETMRQQAERT